MKISSFWNIFFNIPSNKPLIYVLIWLIKKLRVSCVINLCWKNLCWVLNPDLKSKIIGEVVLHSSFKQYPWRFEFSRWTIRNEAFTVSNKSCNNMWKASNSPPIFQLNLICYIVLFTSIYPLICVLQINKGDFKLKPRETKVSVRSCDGSGAGCSRLLFRRAETWRARAVFRFVASVARRSSDQN